MCMEASLRVSGFQQKIPTTDVEKDDLLEAGLGEKQIEFPSLDDTGETICSTPHILSYGMEGCANVCPIAECWSH